MYMQQRSVSSSMIDELSKLMTDEEKDLRELLELLQSQHISLLNKDLPSIETLDIGFNECNKRITEKEVQRRELLGESSISEILRNSSNSELIQAHKTINNTLKQVVSMKKPMN